MHLEIDKYVGCGNVDGFIIDDIGDDKHDIFDDNVINRVKKTCYVGCYGGIDGDDVFFWIDVKVVFIICVFFFRFLFRNFFFSWYSECFLLSYRTNWNKN